MSVSLLVNGMGKLTLKNGAEMPHFGLIDEAIHGTAEIMSTQCSAHNVGRTANEPEAVRILLLQKVYEYGWSHMAEWFETFLGTFKVRPTELELERMIDK